MVSNASQIHEPADSSTSNGISSSALVQPRSSIGSLLSLNPKLPWGSNLTLAESSFSLSSQIFKKELPGRTLQFTYDIAATPLIGAKFNRGPKETLTDTRNEDSATSSSSSSCWRKPYASQVITFHSLIISLFSFTGRMEKGNLHFRVIEVSFSIV